MRGGSRATKADHAAALCFTHNLPSSLPGRGQMPGLHGSETRSSQPVPRFALQQSRNETSGTEKGTDAGRDVAHLSYLFAPRGDEVSGGYTPSRGPGIPAGHAQADCRRRDREGLRHGGG